MVGQFAFKKFIQEKINFLFAKQEEQVKQHNGNRLTVDGKNEPKVVCA